jgi:hypothetical protein
LWTAGRLLERDQVPQDGSLDHFADHSQEKALHRMSSYVGVCACSLEIELYRESQTVLIAY